MTYSCKDRPPFEQSIPVQDGWENSWARRMVDMQFTMDPSCVYSTSELGQADEKCTGCKWRTDDAGRTPETPALADGTSLHGGIQGPLLEQSAGDSTRSGDGGTTKPADSGDAKALEKRWPGAAIYQPTEEK